MSAEIIFGIDGGGTHSRIVLEDLSGNILARSEAGSTNIYSVSKEEVYENLSRLLDSALEAAGLEKKDLSAGCIGSAGLGRDSEKVLFQEFIDLLLWPEFPVKLCTDGETLLCGGLEKLEGYCLISGTGSVALGRSREGRMVRAGGHGFILGDEGSASWIGRTAIARCFRSLEMRDLPTDMPKALMETARLSNFDDFIHYVHYNGDKKQIAALAPAVRSAAQNGDHLALDILRVGAEELALLVKSVLDQSPWIKHRELVLAGGIIEHDIILTKMLKEKLTEQFPDLQISAPKGSALDGACMLAANLLI